MKCIKTNKSGDVFGRWTIIEKGSTGRKCFNPEFGRNVIG